MSIVTACVFCHKVIEKSITAEPSLFVVLAESSEIKHFAHRLCLVHNTKQALISVRSQPSKTIPYKVQDGFDAFTPIYFQEQEEEEEEEEEEEVDKEEK